MITQQHFTTRELAALWGISAAKVRAIFRNEEGVFRLQGPSGHYTTQLIPESTARRVYQRFCQKPFKAKLPLRNPRRVVFLRDRDRLVA